MSGTRKSSGNRCGSILPTRQSGGSQVTVHHHTFWAQDVVVEIPVGKQQILFHPSSDQWSPRGDVLRCLIDDTEEGQVTNTIDEHEMTLTEFGRLLLTHAGCGMRIAIVPDNRTHINPEVEVREPDDDA